MKSVTKSLAVGLSALALAASLSGCGPESPKTFEAKGKIEAQTLGGASCTSQNARVVKSGDEVKIQAKGNTVAMGKVGTGKLDDRSATGDGYICSFDFTVSDVPAGEKFYTVVVEGQGEKEVQAEELTSGRAVLVSYKLDNRPS